MKFLILDGELLKNKVLNPTDKIIISFLYNLEKGGKKFYGGLEFLADEVGLEKEYLRKRFSVLQKHDLISITEDGVTLNKSFSYICNFDNMVKMEDAINLIAQSMVKGA